jgi:hypothetical protein
MAEWRDELSHMAIYNAEYLRELSKLSWDQALQGEWHGSLLDDICRRRYFCFFQTRSSFSNLFLHGLRLEYNCLGTRILKTTTAVFRFSKKQRIYVAA